MSGADQARLEERINDLTESVNWLSAALREEVAHRFALEAIVNDIEKSTPVDMDLVKSMLSRRSPSLTGRISAASTGKEIRHENPKEIVERANDLVPAILTDQKGWKLD